MITTSLEESWECDKPVLFLGEWCKRFSRKAQWKEIDFKILSYHWDDRIKLFDDYKYLHNLHEDLLQDLTKQLNDIHGVNHSIRYWRILIGPWLGIFTQILFDRWTCIQDAVNKYDISSTVVLTGNENKLIPNDAADFFSRLVAGNDWDHYLYSVILQEYTEVKCKKRIRHSFESIKSDTKPANSWKHKIKKSLLFTYAWATSFLSRDHDAFFLTTYMSLLDDIKIQLRLRQFPQIRLLKSSVRVNIDSTQRQWTVKGSTSSDFEVFLRYIIPRQIPALYLEGYNHLMKQAENLTWPKNPKVIFTSNSHHSNDVFKAWSAEKVEQGAPLVIGQHGGHYGIGLWSFTEDHEVAISTCYLSWGWTESDQLKIKPVGQLKPKLPIVDQNLERQGILMVTTTLPCKSYRMYSVVVARQWLDYFEDSCTFVKNLPESISNVLTVRLHSQDRDWDQVERWRERFPTLHLDKTRSSIVKTILQSRLVICTYNATTILESIRMNVPTIIFWNPEQWEVRDSAQPYFEDLKRAGVFHETPESAAQYISTIWDNVESWWVSHEVQEAVNHFIERYCVVSDDLARVEDVLQDAIISPSQPNL